MRFRVANWPTNQIQYLVHDLGCKCIRIRYMYTKISRNQVANHGGRRFIRSHPSIQTADAVQVNIPTKSQRTTRDLMEQYAKEKQIQCEADWKTVNLQDVRAFAKENRLPVPSSYHKSVRSVLAAAYPKQQWKTLNTTKPRNYWKDKENIREFLNSFAKRNNIVEPGDWNRVNKHRIAQQGGKGIFFYYASLEELLSDIYTNVNWEEELNAFKPHGYWNNTENQRTFLNNIAKRYQLHTAEDWSRINASIIRKEGGRGLLSKYKGIYEMLCSLYPEMNWDACKPSTKPKNYWKDKKNHRLFFEEFAKENNIRSFDEWKEITAQMICDAGGYQLLRKYESLFHALEDNFPEFQWNPFEFTLQLPRGFWKRKDNQKLFMEYIAKKYNIQKLEDWKGISAHDIIKEGGVSFIRQYPNFYAALRAIYPDCENALEIRSQAPKDYWGDIKNVREFVKKFEIEYGITKHEDWYRISIKQFREFGGTGLLKKYNFRLITLLTDTYPDMEWDEEALSRSNKQAQQRWLFITLQRLFPDYQIVENFLFNCQGKGTYEFDVFIPELSLAFEYHGVHHYTDSPQFGNVELYQLRDKQKQKACKENDIHLVVIPYWWDNKTDSLVEYIHQVLPQVCCEIKED